MSVIQSIQTALQRIIGDDAHDGRLKRTLRYAIDLTAHCFRSLARDRAGEMAAALTYRTIFSLIPLLAMGLLVFNAFGGFSNLGDQVRQQIYEYFGLHTLALPQERAPGEPDWSPSLNAPPPAAPLDTPPAATLDAPAPDVTLPPPSLNEPLEAPAAGLPPLAESPQTQQQIRARIDDIISTLVDKTSNLNFGNIGIVGLALLIWAALALAVTVEDCFNRVYQSGAGRPWPMRIIIYWAVITLGPVLLSLSIYITSQLITFVSQVHVFGVLFRGLGQLGALGSSWLLLFLLYLLMPNAKVHARSAAIGSLVAAVLWETSKWLFGLYVAKTLPYSAVYGALGLIPLFLFWMYIAWIIVLFGLELTYAMQTLPGYRLKQAQAHREQYTPADPAWIIPIMRRVAQAFNNGKTIDAQSISDELGLPLAAVNALSMRLGSEGLLLEVKKGRDSQDAGLMLAKPPAMIPLRLLIDIGQGMSRTVTGKAAWSDNELLACIAQAERDAAGDSTLQTLIEANK